MLLSENKIDLICFFQKWPETYSYTINEAINSGIPVLSFDIGAGAERIKKYNFGWTISLDMSTEEIANKIKSIFDNKEDYQEKLNSIKNYKQKSVKTMCIEYKKIYNISPKNKSKACDFNIMSDYIFTDDAIIEKMNDVLKSTKWKLINKIKFPDRFVYFVRKIRNRGE